MNHNSTSSSSVVGTHGSSCCSAACTRQNGQAHNTPPSPPDAQVNTKTLGMYVVRMLLNISPTFSTGGTFYRKEQNRTKSAIKQLSVLSFAVRLLILMHSIVFRFLKTRWTNTFGKHFLVQPYLTDQLMCQTQNSPSESFAIFSERQSSKQICC